MLVPALWNYEVANALLAGEVRKRLGPREIRDFVALLTSLSLVQDMRDFSDLVSPILPLARKYSLSAYDAAYLELSIRHGIALATCDQKLEKAARRAGVRLFEPPRCSAKDL